MKEKIKDIGYGVLGIGLIVLIIGAFALLVIGGAKLFETFYPVLEKISTFVWGIVWLLLFLSLAPRLRKFTGNGIIIGTYVGGAIFWLLSFYVTYSLWGFLGIIIGVLFLGLGVFFTAILALIFNGQFMGALGFVFILAQIYLFRMFGLWILTKYRSKEIKSEVFQENTKEEETLQLRNEVSGNSYDPEKGSSLTSSFCPNCGNKIEESAVFCTQCGNKLLDKPKTKKITKKIG